MLSSRAAPRRPLTEPCMRVVAHGSSDRLSRRAGLA